MKIVLLSFLTILSALITKPQSSFAQDFGLKTFKTDGCTMFVDGTPKSPKLWRHCCIEHDMRYWFGGDLEDMNKTDLRLKACVKEVAGKTWAELIYTGVRLGHKSPIKNKTQWSWGWMKKRENIKLSNDEIQYVIEELRRLPLDHDMIEQFIERNFENNIKI